MVEFSGIFGDEDMMKQLSKIFLCLVCIVFIFQSETWAADSDELVVRYDDKVTIFH